MASQDDFPVHRSSIRGVQGLLQKFAEVFGAWYACPFTKLLYRLTPGGVAYLGNLHVIRILQPSSPLTHHRWGLAAYKRLRGLDASPRFLHDLSSALLIKNNNEGDLVLKHFETTSCSLQITHIESLLPRLITAHGSAPGRRF